MMEPFASLRQFPPPGSRSVKFRGDTVTFTLSLSQPMHGRAWVRTNIGQAATTRRAVIEAVDKNIPPLGTDWYDIPMRQSDAQMFSIVLPLGEVGHFEAKCFYLPEGKTKPLWPEGPNAALNVQPADTCAANIIYNAFVRQFGPNKSGGYAPDAADRECMSRLDQKAYTVIPRSGTFRDLIAELDFIFGVLGCRYLHLLPIHPTPTTYGRMGRFGSPYAALHFTGIDPALAVFDIKATPLEQFAELVDAVHARFGKLIIDIAVNHTGWAASLHESHPRWLLRDEQGEIHRPGAWGVTWSDLTSLDYSQKDLWKYVAHVFLTWCRRGVDGFRCDAGYMIPLPAWTYIIAMVRQQYPDTVFLLEGLGGRISVTRELLNLANFNWAYSELFQNYDRLQIEYYLPEALDISAKDGIAIHYAETHDNNRLASRSRIYARMRTALCALLSQQGGFGFANGVEWLADVKINVHEAHSLNWGSPENQVEHLRRLHLLLRSHPAFFEDVDLQFIHQHGANAVVVLRRHNPTGKALLIVANLDDEQEVWARWEPPPDMSGPSLTDLLTGTPVATTRMGEHASLRLLPGQVMCLTADTGDAELTVPPASFSFVPKRLLDQRFRAKVLEVYCRNCGNGDLADFDLAEAALRLREDPVEFCRRMNGESDEHRVVFWEWPRDLHREVMLPAGHFLLIRAGNPFRATITDLQAAGEPVLAGDESLPAADGTQFALLVLRRHRAGPMHGALKMVLYETTGSRHETAPLLLPGDGEDTTFNVFWNRNELQAGGHLFLSTNGAGGMCRAQLRWGELQSKYDGLLAANLDLRYPVDRWMFLARCRVWINYQGYSQEICFDSLDGFWLAGNKGYWRYKVPTGQGQRIDLIIALEMLKNQNAVRLSFHRPPSHRSRGKLGDRTAVQLIVRPDIEDRSFHENTKAYLGPEYVWPDALECQTDGFTFRPSSERTLTVRVSSGTFVRQPEWLYMVHRALEKERGMDPDSDLWSPGYFSINLAGNETVDLTAFANEAPPETPGRDVVFPPRSADLEQTLLGTLKAYVVRRGTLSSVIAGYPWFLDWGRDSLIVARGLLRIGQTDAAADILKLLGEFEDRGTLPNMIYGDEPANRDTSDAPLWYIVVLAELIRKKRSRAILAETVNGRMIRDIAISIGRSYIAGTPNAIRMDGDSGLIYSPAHFSWMDTNDPACTPRQGYCIEIQALWHAALSFLADADAHGPTNWRTLAARVRQSLLRLFFLREGYLADCLCASRFEPAENARPDDALRPNQLLAVTLDAVADKAVGRAVLDACQTLLVPGAIRSLADAPVKHPLEIRHAGVALGDPLHPYRGSYMGDEDTARKPAYHNGTAWTWLYPAYCEAYVKVYGEKGIPTARALLMGSLGLLRDGCAGHFPEILDGDYPHRPRGCDAQAWGASEWLRVWECLKTTSAH